MFFYLHNFCFYFSIIYGVGEGSFNGSKNILKKSVVCINISALIISCLFSFIFVNADDTSEEPALEGLSIHYMDGTLDVKYQSMRPYIIIHNNSGMDVDMADLRVRYYYEKEGVTEESLHAFIQQ